jgi:hypothetical protein
MTQVEVANPDPEMTLLEYLRTQRESGSVIPEGPPRQSRPDAATRLHASAQLTFVVVA